MNELIPAIQFRTDLPFGYLIFWLTWLMISLWAAKNVIQLCWKKKFRSVKLYIASVLLLVNSAYLYVDITIEEYLDYNPRFVEADMFGEWQDESSSFSLLQDGTAVLNLDKEHRTLLGLENGKGYWHKHQSYYISIGKGQKESSSKSVLFRVISFKGKYRLIIAIDPLVLDGWNGDLGFKREDFVKENLLTLSGS